MGLQDLYQHFCKLVKYDVIKVLQHFYSHSLNTLKLNHTMICLFFLQGKYILNNVLAAHEIIHHSKIHKEKGLVL
jgi:hypothetical protein